MSAGSIVVELLRHSGNRALRALIADVGAEQILTIKTEVDALVSRADLLFEWSGDRHVAIDVPPGGDAESILDYFAIEEDAGRLNWEWSDIVPFRI